MRTLLKLAGGLLALLLLVVGGLLLKARSGLEGLRDIPTRPIIVPTGDSAAIARGRHLATVVMACSECHGADFGGRAPFAIAGPLGTINSANLTFGRGGVINRYDDATLARTIRHAVTVTGKAIPIMPAISFLTASDRDVGAVIAYLRTLPPVDREIPPSRITLPGRLLYALGKFQFIEADRVDHATPPSAALEPAVSTEYGAYLAVIGGCTGCHGPGLSGGKIPGAPPDWRPSANITPEGLAGYTEEGFIRALRTGVRPNGVPIDTLMPWRVLGRMDSVEIRAVWRYLQSVPRKPWGGR